MPKTSEKALEELSELLDVQLHFLHGCLEASVIEIYPEKKRATLGNGTALRLRRLQRICLTFNVELPIALILAETAATRSKAAHTV